MPLRAVLLVLLLPLIAGCGANWGWSDIGGMLFNDAIERLRVANTRKIAQLKVGMPRSEVELRMGDDKAGGGLVDILHGRTQYLQARNPMRQEKLKGADGLDYDVVFYYTDLHERDNRITEDELTPIIYLDGKIAGIGYAFLRERAPKVAQSK